MTKHKDMVDPELHECINFATTPPPASGYVNVTDGLGGSVLTVLPTSTARTYHIEKTLTADGQSLSTAELEGYWFMTLTGTPGPTIQAVLYVNNIMQPMAFCHF